MGQICSSIQAATTTASHFNMYKLVVLACVLAAVAAKPTGLIAAPGAVAVHAAPAVVTYAAHAPVVSHAVVHAAPAVVAHAPAAVAVHSPAAIVRTVNHVAYHVEPVEQHGYKIVY